MLKFMAWVLSDSIPVLTVLKRHICCQKLQQMYGTMTTIQSFSTPVAELKFKVSGPCVETSCGFF